jgi:adenylosuccinate synthase
MPVSVVVGGQFGSEGKGKTALEIVRRDQTVAAAIRVGGTNSGHTALSSTGRRYALRQLPAASIDRSVRVILPPGSYIDIGIFKEEAERLELGPDQIAVSFMARIITNEHKAWERDSDLDRAIGSTQSGTGAAVMAMTARGTAKFPIRSIQAEDVPELQPYLKDTGSEVRQLLDAGKR